MPRPASRVRARFPWSYAFLVTACAGLGLGATMCSSSPTPSTGSDASTPTGTTAFRGVLVGAGDVSGVIELTSSLPPTTTGQNVRTLDAVTAPYTIGGTLTLNVPGLGPVPLTGTLDLASNTATFTGNALGGLVTFQGKYAAGVLEGTATLADGRTLPFYAAATSYGIKTYCGSFSGSQTGRWSMLTVGSRALAVFAPREGAPGTGTGSIERDLVTLALTPEGSATGNASAGTIAGSWRRESASGAFAVSEGACNALTPAGTLPDGGVLTDAGDPDGGPSAVPAEIFAQPGAVPIEYMTVAGTKLVYTLGHPYFSGLVTMRSVGKDGTGDADLIPTNNAMTERKKVVGGLTATASKAFYIAGTSAENDANLISVPIGGGAPTDHGIIGGVSRYDFIAGTSLIVNDGTNVLVSFTSSSTSAVRAFDLNGTASGQITNLVGAYGLGLDGSELYFGSFDGLMNVSKTLSGTPTTFSARAEYGNLSSVTNLAFDTQNVYFTSSESSSSTVWRKAKTGGTIAPVIAAVPGRVRDLTLHGNDLYFTYAPASGGQQGGASATLFRVPKTATSATAATVGAANPGSITSDGAYVFYANGTKVMRLKP